MLTVIVAPDGRHVWSGSCDNTVRCWDAATGTEVRRLPEIRQACWGLAISPDGRLAVGEGSGPGETAAWDLATGELLFRQPVAATRFAFLPDGKALLCSGQGLLTLRAAANCARRFPTRSWRWASPAGVSRLPASGTR